MQKIDYAQTIAARTSRVRRAQGGAGDRKRAADLVARYTLPMLRAWAATYVADTAAEREAAAAAMRACDPNSLLGPAAKARLHEEVKAIHRRAKEREEARKATEVCDLCGTYYAECDCD